MKRVVMNCFYYETNIKPAGYLYMQIRTILNQFHKQPGFIYGKVRFDEARGKKSIVVPLRPRKGAKPTCSGCHKVCSGYDTLSERLFQFVPVWGFLVFFEYSMRRADCADCGVIVEEVPWGDGKKLVTKTFAWFVAHWAKLLSWTEVGRQFSMSWGTVLNCVETAVNWGRANMNLDGITAIGIDEIARAKGHQYVTLVYQIGGGVKRLLHVAKDRKVESLRKFFTWIGKERSAKIEFVCSDMWKPYLKVIREMASQAVHVLDRFHIMTHFNKAIDKVRAGEATSLAKTRKGEIVKGSRWALLKRRENLTEKQEVKLSDLLKANLKSVRAYLLREEFQQLWEYVSPGWAGKFIDHWTKRAMRSRLDPIKRVAKMIRRHKPLIINWFKAKGQISNGTVEGLNGKGRVITKRHYGFRTFKCLQLALYHGLGELPVPKFTHRFW